MSKETSVMELKHSTVAKYESMLSNKTSQSILDAAQDFGGIYIGDNRASSENYHTKNVVAKRSSSNLSLTPMPNDRNIDDENKCHNVDVECDTLGGSSQDNKSNRCKINYGKTSRHFKSYPDEIFDDSNTTIPNQVPEVVNHHFPNTSSEKGSPENSKNIHGIEGRSATFRIRSLRADSEGVNRIDVVPEPLPNSTTSDRASLPSINDNLDNSLDNSNIENLYKESKEHKSVMRAVIFYTVCTFVTLVGLIFINFFASKVLQGETSVYMIILFSSLHRIQRTFATILMSVYCFERLRALFRTTIENLYDYVVNLVT